MICAAWVKYVLLMILFAFSFMCMFNPVIDIYGFGSFFVLQTILTFFVMIDLTQDEMGFKKVLSVAIDSGASPVKMPSVAIPFSWILFAGAGLEFLAAFFMLITTNTVYKRFRGLSMSSENQWRLNFVKYTFVLVTVLMFILLLFYWNFDANYSGHVKIFLLTIMVSIVSIATADLIFANHFTQLISSSTDG